MANDEHRSMRDTQPIPLPRVQGALGEKPVTEAEEGLAPEPAQRRPPDRAASDQDGIPTPVPFVVPSDNLAAAPRAQRTGRALWAVVILSLVISLTSLTLNAVLIYKFLGLRSMAIDGLDAAIAAVEKLGGQGIHYEYRFNETIPFSGDIPFKQDMVFPFKGDIPIKTTVQVPINAGALGQFVIDVPIDTSFYVDLEVPISVDQTIHVETEIPLDMVIPIDIRADDPAIQQQVNQILEWLLRLRESF